MNPDKPQSQDVRDAERKRLFSELYEEALTKKAGDFIEYRGGFPKEEFLDFLVREKGVLLHGSNEQAIQELEPRQANCRSKKFGNMKGVYAVEDPLLPIFYSIKDKNRFKGLAVSGFEVAHDESGSRKKYHFEVSRGTLEENPWSEGVVYVLPKETFEQGTDDEGRPIDEWMSKIPVQPIAKLKVAPDDFRYLDKIQPID